jgi:hypothetical protein
MRVLPLAGKLFDPYLFSMQTMASLRLIRALMEESVMRTTIMLDDQLLATAQELTGFKEKSRLVRRGA